MRGRTLCRPRTRLLELRREPQQRRLVAKAPGYLNSDRKTARAPMERQRDRGLPGGVEERSKRRVSENLMRPFLAVMAPRSWLISPSGAGGRAMVGVMNASTFSKNAPTWRDTIFPCAIALIRSAAE